MKSRGITAVKKTTPNDLVTRTTKLNLRIKKTPGKVIDSANCRSQPSVLENERGVQRVSLNGS